MAARLKEQREKGIRLLLASGAQTGTKNINDQMKNYVYKRRDDGVHIINLGKTWEKLMLAARALVAIDNP